MYDILDRPLHWIPVKWPGLEQGDGEEALSKPTEHEIEIRVDLVDRDEAQKLFPRFFGDETAPVEDELKVFKAVVKDWRKIKANGRVPEFNDENIKLLLKVPMFASTFAATYIAALGGRTATREGNSESLPAGGQADAENAGPTTKATSSGSAASSA